MAEELPRAVRAAWERARLACETWTRSGESELCIERALDGGHSNTVWRIAGTGESWVLRVPDADPPRGVNRAREVALHALAGAQHLAPALHYSEVATGVLLMADLSNARRNTQAAAPSVSELAALFRAIHRLEWRSAVRTPGLRSGEESEEGDGETGLWRPLNSATRLEEWRWALLDANPLSDLDKSVQQALAASASRVASTVVTPRVCHNDLLRANRLRDQRGRLVAIDWEYACLGDPYFDLAVAATELSPAASENLLRSYLGREATTAERLHLRDQQGLYLAIAVCWYTARRSAPAMVTVAVDALIKHYGGLEA